MHPNPCRARLVADPLAWPFSTHRDAVGLAVDPVVPRAGPDELPAQIAREIGVHRATVHRTRASPERAVTLVARVVGDPRFPALLDHDLRRSPTWWRYRDLQ